MNILQILPELNVGGVETGTADFAKRLVKAGHKAVVVSAGGGMVEDMVAAGVIHYQLPVHKKDVFHILKMIPRLAEIIKKENIDIVHARSRVPAWIAYYSCRKVNKPLITTCHGYYSKHLFSKPMGWGKLVICPSKVIARHMVEDFDVPLERIRLVPRSVDIEKFRYHDSAAKRKAKEFNVGIIGRITPLKGHMHFIKAMARVARKIPYLKIWIVGDAPQSKAAYKEQLQVLVRRLGLWDSTQFLGTQKDIPEVLRQMDLVVLASTTHDAFPRSILEAQACGVPVVATSVGGVIDIIEDNKNGLLVPPADPDSIAEAVMRIYKDPGLGKQMAEKAYKKVKEQYTAEHLVQNTLNVYTEAIENYRLLILKFSALGDVILSSAALRTIREKFRQGYKISLLVGEQAKDVLLRCPYIDELMVVDFKNKDKGLGRLLDIGKGLRQKNFDIVIDLQNNRKSHILSYLSRSINRYGYDNKKFGWLLNNRIKDMKDPVDPVTHQFRVLKMLGIDMMNPYLEVWPSEEDRQYIDEFLNAEWLSQSQRLIGLNLSASHKWICKNWPLTQMAKLCEELGYKEIRIVVTGTENDLALAHELIGMVKNTKIINACGRTSVNQLACLIKSCSVYISPDSSPLHIAAAVNTPFVALFGPTDYRRHLPPAKNFIVIKKDLACSPCYKPRCKKNECMELISHVEVLEAVQKLLK